MDTLCVYLADIRPLAGEEERGLALLPPQRRAQALAYVPPEARLRSLAAGLLLRHVLGVTGDDAITLGEYGKPSLPGGPCFSLSHAGQYAALAVFSHTVGVDVEPLRTPPDVARRMFLPRELAWLEEAPGDPMRFFTLWTRLEAALKADGRGLCLEGRDFPLLEGGGPWHLDTLAFDGHLISCAAAAPFAPTLAPVETGALLRP